MRAVFFGGGWLGLRDRARTSHICVSMDWWRRDGRPAEGELGVSIDSSPCSRSVRPSTYLRRCVQLMAGREALEGNIEIRGICIRMQNSVSAPLAEEEF